MMDIKIPFTILITAYLASVIISFSYPPGYCSPIRTIKRWVRATLPKRIVFTHYILRSTIPPTLNTAKTTISPFCLRLMNCVRFSALNTGQRDKTFRFSSFKLRLPCSKLTITLTGAKSIRTVNPTFKLLSTPFTGESISFRIVNYTFISTLPRAILSVFLPFGNFEFLAALIASYLNSFRLLKSVVTFLIAELFVFFVLDNSKRFIAKSAILFNPIRFNPTFFAAKSWFTICVFAIVKFFITLLTNEIMLFVTRHIGTLRLRYLREKRRAIARSAILSVDDQSTQALSILYHNNGVQTKYTQSL